MEVVGPSGVGKTTLVSALSGKARFATAYEGHAGRPFQRLFKQDRHYGLANQMDYLLLRAEQERQLRASPLTGLMDGGLDLDYHGFARLFHARGWLSDAEFDLCRRFYELTRSLLPPPELVIWLTASDPVIHARLASRRRINIASAEDTALFNRLLQKWLGALPATALLHVDVSADDPAYSQTLPRILAWLSQDGRPLS